MWQNNVFLLQVLLILLPPVVLAKPGKLISDSRECSHSAHTKNVIHDVHIEDAHDVHKRSIDQHIRIQVYFDESTERLSLAHEKLVKAKVWEAVAYWQDTLLVRATKAPIRLNRQCLSSQVRYLNGKRYCSDGCASRTMCGAIEIPEEHLHSCEWWDSYSNTFHSPPDRQPGVDGYDYILYVAAHSAQTCNGENTVAFAAHCQQESAFDRPIAGYFSICPNFISTNHHSHEELLSTLKHEILHALGFTAGLFAFYRDKNGRPLTPRNIYNNKPEHFDERSGIYLWSDRVVARVTRNNWRLKGQVQRKVVNMIVLPTVVKEVRSHFNCPDLEGAELENQGINGTALTHWEKRVFENEAMTGAYTQSPSLSRITLALMEDTGWYKPRYERADRFEWGKNLGCDFVKKSCYEWIQTRIHRNADIHPFCIESNVGRPVMDCTRGRKSVAICNLAEFSRPLPPEYQYFSAIPGVDASEVSRFGGNVPLADYCPYLQELVWKREDEILRGSVCSSVKNNLGTGQNFLLERYSPRAKCFNHPTPWILRQCNRIFTPHSGSGCYEYDCSSETGLTIIVNGQRHRCQCEGQVLSVVQSDKYWLYTGNITCPSCLEVCQDHGVICPQDSYMVAKVINPVKYPYVPCRATTTSFSSSFSTVFNIIAANILCFLIIYLCHR